jgi:very-short-patch-repair endonuclease
MTTINHQEPGEISPDPSPMVEDSTQLCVRIRAAMAAQLNLADFQNAVPALHELAVVNETAEPITNLTLTITSEPGFLKSRTWSLDSVGAGATYHLTDLDVKLDGALLSRLTEAEPATLHIELRKRGEADEVVAQHDCVIELLARNQWGGLRYMPEMVAAFVQPNDPAVDRLLKATALALQAAGKSGSIDGYTHGAKRAWELASGIWTAVLQRKLNYALPPASFELCGQKVRSASQVLDSGLGTCLDLALLFAACLEQAHLNPLLVFTHGHAFVGVWLRDEQFSTAVVDDITAVRTRLQLQELLVFETTLAAQGQPVAFGQSLNHANRQLSEAEDDKFELVVDVKRARMSRIKPLALALAVADPAPSADEPEIVITVEEAPDLPEEPSADIATADLDPKDRLARWQRRLLDLSLRNALLNFKAGKKALQLDVCAPDLEDAMAEGQTVKLLSSPLLMEGRDPRSLQIHEARSLEDLRRAHAADALKRREVCIRLDAHELDTRLVELYRGARNALQEGGSNTLFLALGFLIWSRPDKPDARIKAPLILLPVTLERKSARSGFAIHAHEDEPRFNPTLVEMLRQDFELELGVPLGELPRDDAGLDLTGIWKRVRAAIKDIRGWEVSEDVVLSMFSFAKYLMWKDLAERTGDLRKSPVVAHLIDTPREPYKTTVVFPDKHRLDREFSPQQVFSPLPADSSQLSAVMAAARGKDFVLIGPPGTGKSQTIANLIAQCLAEGKRVLFVAEKVAALDVVYRRLREVGLGEFCLELHSNKTRKLDVLAQLQQSWQSKGEVDTQTWNAQASHLEALRTQLSTYVERLHSRYANGLTVFRAIGVVVAGSNVPEVALRWPSPLSHNEEGLTRLRDLAARLHVNSAAVGSHNLLSGPLATVETTEWSARWQQDLVLASRALQDASLQFMAATRDFCSRLSIGEPALHRQARSSLGVLARALPHAHGHDWSFCALPHASELSKELRQGLDLLSQHRALSAELSPPWSAQQQDSLHQALGILERRRQVHADLGSPWPAVVADSVQRSIACLEESTRLRSRLSVKYGAGIDKLNVAQLQRAWDKACKSMWPMSWLAKRQVRSALESVIEGTGEPRIAEDLDALVRIRGLAEAVGQMDLGTALAGLWAGSRTRTDHLSCALQANTALQAARAHLSFNADGLDPAEQGHCGEHWAREVKRLLELRALDERIAACADLSNLSDQLWQGHETDIELLRAALAFEQERMSLKDRGAPQQAHEAVAAGRCGNRLRQDHVRLCFRAALESKIGALPGLTVDCCSVWAGLDTNTELASRALKFQSSIDVGLSGLAGSGVAMDAARHAIHQLLAADAASLSELDTTGRVCQGVLTCLSTLHAAIDAFSKLATHSEQAHVAFGELTPADLVDQAQALEEASTGLRAWCAWRSAQVEARTVGLAALVSAIEAGVVDPANVPTAFEVNYARWWLAAAVDDDGILKRFVSAEHEQRIQSFRALDDEFTSITRQWIRAKLCESLPAMDSHHRNIEWGTLRREMSKKRNHMPLRQLLEKIPSAVLQLTPCLLMSPLSIAQYLSAETSSFDLVVFDEASQIPVWDAIGAMARGKQVVMVGDPKQLPPTNFFGRTEIEEGDAEDVEGDLESILDECLGASLPYQNLSWHYRSRHESLIAFSNHRYYGGGLVTFPSPVTDDRAVSFHLVNGQYEKGGARINQPEARALVADLVARLKAPGFRASGLTIGVVTFNSEQQGLIEDLLDEERRRDPGLESYFSEVELEPVFVKNLESVQGDERDIMYFSITYGPNSSGAVSMNFGPLNRDGGERRLNVAVTRARHELRVFSSLRGEQMDLSRTKAVGVRDLKHFLEFAERGRRALAEAHHGSQGGFDSPFESAVAAALGQKGWQVHTQIGASSFRVDLGVVHPDYAGRYLAGVECDGATYHRSATARDRDKLREQVLRGLGWEILRIWSTDWWVNPGGTLEQVHLRLTELLRLDREREATAAAALAEQALPTVIDQQHREDPSPHADAINTAAEAIAQAEPQSDLFVRGAQSECRTEAGELAYARVAAPPEKTPTLAATPVDDRPAYIPSNPVDSVPAGVISAERFHEPDYDAVLEQMVGWVIEREGPVLDTVLGRRIARAHGFQRTGNRIQDRVDAIALRRFRTTQNAAGAFYWPAAVAPGASIHFRWPLEDENARGIDEICDQELRSLAHYVRQKSGLSGEAALVAMARALGLQKLRATSRARLEPLLSGANP